MAAAATSVAADQAIRFNMEKWILAIVYTEEENIFAGFHVNVESAQKYIDKKFGDDVKGTSMQEVFVDNSTAHKLELFQN